MLIETAVKSVSGGQIEDFALAEVMARRGNYKQKNEKKNASMVTELYDA